MVMVSPFANSVRATPVQAAARNQGLGSIAQLLEQLKSAGPLQEAAQRIPTMQPSLAIKEQFPQVTADIRQEPTRQIPAEIAEALESSRGPENVQAVAQPANPFEGNEQYQALMEYQQSLAPTQEQQDRLQELRSAFEGTGAFKDYRIQQMEQQMQQMQQRYRQPRSPMGMGLGMANPYGMQPFRQFGRPQQFPMQMPMQQPMRQFGAMGYNQPQQYMPQPQ